jgi:hypothetical protein
MRIVPATMVLVAVGAHPADALKARLRWRPSPDARVAGYNVYVRPARTPYATALDARLPARASDGTMTFDVPNLVDGRSYHFAVAAYLSDRTESDLSGELALGSLDPCAADRCRSRSSCDFSRSPDGTPCGGCDVCRTGTCARGSGLPLASRTFRLAGRSTTPSLAASGSFTPSRPIDPTRTGMTVELADAAGRMLHRLQVPAGAFRRGDGGSVFRLRQRLAGVRHLTLRVVDGLASVSTELVAAELGPAFDLPRLAWGLRLGADACAADGDLVCGGTASVSICR